MKAALNAVPSVSVLDGWWDEAYDGTNGWAVGRGGTGDGATDEEDAESLYRVLENEVIPAFFDRDAIGLPRAWITVMRGALRTATEQFTAERVLRDYVETFYRPVAGIGEVPAGIR
jgi:glucan phosphorylase